MVGYALLVAEFVVLSIVVARLTGRGFDRVDAALADLHTQIRQLRRELDP